MLNGEVNNVYRVLGSFLDEWSQAYPADSRDCERDKTRLHSLLKTRGLKYALLDLPAMGKILDAALESAYLPICSVAGFARKSKHKVRLPKLFFGFWNKLFETNGTLRDDFDVIHLKYLRQLLYCYKGYNYECTPSRTKAVLEEFISTEHALPAPTNNWNGDYVDRDWVYNLHLCEDTRLLSAHGSISGSLGNAIQRSYDALTCILGPLDVLDYLPKHGKGAVSDLDQNTTKYVFPGWHKRLDSVFPFFDMTPATFSGHESYDEDRDESSSKLLFVPKTAKSPRLIASEPTSHQWCQQVILDFLKSRYKNSIIYKYISMDNQEASQLMVTNSSMDRSLSTIDLSSASDRVTCYVVERAFRKNPGLVQALHACRTQSVTDGTSHKLIKAPMGLKKFSTMGSACTFPVQSFIFLGIVVGVISYETGMAPSAVLKEYGGRIRVFGDDIICPSLYYDKVCDALHLLHLKVNVDKSFSKGYFRESCGMDSYKGHDVTPVKVLTTWSASRPSSAVATIDSSNNLFLAGFWRASKTLLETVPRWVSNSLPIKGTGDGHSGLISFCGRSVAHLRKVRYSANLCRREYQVFGLVAENKGIPNPEDCTLFEWLKKPPKPDTAIGRERVTVSKTRLRLTWVGDHTIA